jgi:hypothetical protein
MQEGPNQRYGIGLAGTGRTADHLSHNPKVGGSNPPPGTKRNCRRPGAQDRAFCRRWPESAGGCRGLTATTERRGQDQSPALCGLTTSVAAGTTVHGRSSAWSSFEWPVRPGRRSSSSEPEIHGEVPATAANPHGRVDRGGPGRVGRLVSPPVDGWQWSPWL